MGIRTDPETLRRCLELAGEATPPLAETISEKEFMAEVVKLAKRLGYRVYHTTDSRKSEAGFPDLVMTNGHKLIFAELKTADGKLTAEQSNWIDALRATTACMGLFVGVHVWHPRDWPAIQEALA